MGDPRALFGLRKSANRSAAGSSANLTSVSSDHLISEPFDFQHISHAGFGKDGLEVTLKPLLLLPFIFFFFF